jgi:hypothetical protein
LTVAKKDSAAALCQHTPVRPTLVRSPRRCAGDVANEPGAGLFGGELAGDQVRGFHPLLTGQGGALVGAWLAGLQAQLAHQVGDQADAAGDLFAFERGRYPPASGGASRGGEDPLHVSGEFPAPRGGGGHRPVAPGVKRLVYETRLSLAGM